MPLFALSQIKNLVQDLRRLAARLRTRIRAWRNAEASSVEHREVNQERNLTLMPQIDLDKVLGIVGQYTRLYQHGPKWGNTRNANRHITHNTFHSSMRESGNLSFNYDSLSRMLIGFDSAQLGKAVPR